ncbi:hypothetical protein E2320_006172 [Naja naja]|nr:hypothetical protein E2320_006172 [Naja naja]
MPLGDFFHRRSRSYKVVLGEYNLNVQEGPEQHVPINSKDIFVHPSWKPSCLNDKVKLGCIPEPDTVLPNGYPCYITGWGPGGPLPAKMQQALLPVVDYNHCRKPDWWGSSVKQSMVCAGGDVKAGCNGDSGGPLNCQGKDGRWYVHGVTSFVSAMGCNTLRKPTVFTRVSAFDGWILKILRGQ